MACSIETVQTGYCESEIGKLDSRLRLLIVIAQNLAASVEALTGNDVTPEAILERACESGIGRVEDSAMLWRIITQNLCSTIS